MSHARAALPALLAATALGACGAAAPGAPPASVAQAAGAAPSAVGASGRAPEDQDATLTEALTGESAATGRGTGRAGAQARAAILPARPWVLALARRAQLRARPGGRVLATLSLRTQFGTQRILGVAARRDGWVAVRSELLGNGRVGWIPEAAGALMSTPSSVEVDLSRRVLIVHRRGRAAVRFRVGVGALGSSTPPGRYAVTDRLTTGTTAGAYGCCVLALTGRQPHLPQGWGGGDRLAIHGTPALSSIGRAASHGCVRASNATMRRLLGLVLLGAPVWVHD